MAKSYLWCVSVKESVTLCDINFEKFLNETQKYAVEIASYNIVTMQEVN